MWCIYQWIHGKTHKSLAKTYESPKYNYLLSRKGQSQKEFLCTFLFQEVSQSSSFSHRPVACTPSLDRNKSIWELNCREQTWRTVGSSRRKPASFPLAQFLLDAAVRRPFPNMLSLCHSFGFAEPNLWRIRNVQKKPLVRYLAWLWGK